MTDSNWSGLTGSGVGPAGACPAREALPKARMDGEAADRGNVLHEFCRCVTVNPAVREQALAAITEEDWRRTAAGMNLDLALEGLIVLGCEVAFVLNVDKQTCRKIGTNIGRRYADHLKATGQEPLGEWDIPFTVDVLARYGETPVELDYKSGQHIGDPALHMQRRISNAGLLFHYDATSAISRVAYIWESGEIRPDGCESFYMDAVQLCDEVKDIIMRVRATRALVAEGHIPPVTMNRDEQCKYCDAFMYCPGWAGLIRGAKQQLSNIPDLAEIDATTKAEIFDYVKDVLKAAETLEKVLKEHIYRQPLPLDDEYEFSAKDQKGRSYFDQSGARGEIVKLMGRLGHSDTEIEAALAKLQKEGAPTPVIRKRRRLQVIKQAS